MVSQFSRRGWDEGEERVVDGLRMFSYTGRNGERVYILEVGTIVYLERYWYCWNSSWSLVLRWFDGRGRRRRSSEYSICEKSARVFWWGEGVEMPSSSLLIPYQAHNYRATKQAINQPGFNDVQSWLPFDKSVAKVTIVLISVDGLHLRTRTRYNYTVAPGPGRHQLFNHCVLLNNGQGSVLRLLKA